jgi:hypothetical protein
VDPRASTTVEPVAVADETVTELPPAVTSNFDLLAVVELSVSLYVIVSWVPAASMLAEENVGTTPSTSSVPSEAVTAEWVTVALTDASPVFFIVPLSVFAVIDAPSASISPATMVYSNTSVVPGDPDT